MYIGTFWGIFLSFQKIPDFFVVSGICAANLWIFTEKILLALSKLHSTLPLLKNHVWWKKICWKNCNFNNFGVREIFSYFWGQSYARLAKISLCILDERFGEKQLCWESAQAFRPFRNSSKTLSEFWRQFFWQGGHNWILRVQMKIFLFFWRNELKERITFFEQNCIAILLGLWEKKILRVFAAWLRQACQNFVIPVQTNILTNNFSGNLIRFSQFLEFHQKFFRILTKNFRQCGHNCILRAQMKFFLFLERGKWKKTFFFKVSHRYHFQTLSENDFQYFCRHGYGKLVRNSLYMFRRRFLQINFLEGLLVFPHFRKSSKTFPEFWREKVGRVVTTALYMYIGTFLGKLFSFRKVQIFFVVFWMWATNVWTLRKNFLLPLSKLPCPLLKNHFWWKK